MAFAVFLLFTNFLGSQGALLQPYERASYNRSSSSVESYKRSMQSIGPSFSKSGPNVDGLHKSTSVRFRKSIDALLNTRGGGIFFGPIFPDTSNEMANYLKQIYPEYFGSQPTFENSPSKSGHTLKNAMGAYRPTFQNSAETRHNFRTPVPYFQEDIADYRLNSQIGLAYDEFNALSTLASYGIKFQDSPKTYGFSSKKANAGHGGISKRTTGIAQIHKNLQGKPAVQTYGYNSQDAAGHRPYSQNREEQHRGNIQSASLDYATILLHQGMPYKPDPAPAPYLQNNKKAYERGSDLHNTANAPKPHMNAKPFWHIGQNAAELNGTNFLNTGASYGPHLKMQLQNFKNVRIPQNFVGTFNHALQGHAQGHGLDSLGVVQTYESTLQNAATAGSTSQFTVKSYKPYRHSNFQSTQPEHKPTFYMAYPVVGMIKEKTGEGTQMGAYEKQQSKSGNELKHITTLHVLCMQQILDLHCRGPLEAWYLFIQPSCPERSSQILGRLLDAHSESSKMSPYHEMKTYKGSGLHRKKNNFERRNLRHSRAEAVESSSRTVPDLNSCTTSLERKICDDVEDVHWKKTVNTFLTAFKSCDQYQRLV